MNNYSKSQKKEIVTNICNDVVENSKSFKQAIDDAEITRMTFYTWITKFPELDRLYNYAREVRSDVLFEEIIEIADTPEEGEVMTEKPTGIERKVGDMTEHRKLKIDARKWVVAKMQPKKYGNKSDSANEVSDNEINIKFV
jgi:hypothetical protein